jgi:hypothetical protein
MFKNLAKNLYIKRLKETINCYQGKRMEKNNKSLPDIGNILLIFIYKFCV